MLYKKFRDPLFVALILVIGLVAYGYINMSEHSHSADKIGGTLHDLFHASDKTDSSSVDRTQSE